MKHLKVGDLVYYQSPVGGSYSAGPIQAITSRSIKAFDELWDLKTGMQRKKFRHFKRYPFAQLLEFNELARMRILKAGGTLSTYYHDGQFGRVKVEGRTA
ncbi:MAG: hypothetical protein WDO74_18015 [Pseudomonadota bacterium]